MVSAAALQSCEVLVFAQLLEPAAWSGSRSRSRRGWCRTTPAALAAGWGLFTHTVDNHQLFLLYRQGLVVLLGQRDLPKEAQCGRSTASLMIHGIPV